MSLKKSLGLFNKFFASQHVPKEEQIVKVFGQSSDQIQVFSPSGHISLQVGETGLKEGGLSLVQLNTVSSLIGDSAGKYVKDYFCFNKVKIKLDAQENLEDRLKGFDFFLHFVIDLQMSGELTFEAGADLVEFKSLLQTLSIFLEESSTHSGVIFTPDSIYAYNSNSLIKQTAHWGYDLSLTPEQLNLLLAFTNYCIGVGLAEEEFIHLKRVKDALVVVVGQNMLILTLDTQEKMRPAQLEQIFEASKKNSIVPFSKSKMSAGLDALAFVDNENSHGLLLLDQNKETGSYYLKSKHDYLVMEELELDENSCRLAIASKILKPCLACLSENEFETRAAMIPDMENMAQQLYFHDSYLDREIIVCCVMAGDFFNA